MSEVRIFGIRHHGPGCARALSQVLQEWQPDCVLLEGLPETPIEWAADPSMVPPVAAVAYHARDTSRSVFSPFAEFSPEWVALQWAIQNRTTVRFIDMPAAHLFARDWVDDRPPFDPFSLIGEVSELCDGETWWDDQIEAHAGSSDLFVSVAELVRELRRDEPVGEFDALREAFMRLGIHQAVNSGFTKVAVAVGAWHLPAVEQWASISIGIDQKLIARLPKVDVHSSWVPWSYSRLTTASGYGAGVQSPSYYEHRWHTEPEKRTTEWLSMVAQVLRTEQMDVSPASVIEATRLAEVLAAIRGRREPGLAELTESAQSVLAEGKSQLLRLVHEELIVGRAFGSIPPNLPSVPLVQDFEREVHRLKLKKTGEVEFDIRKELDLGRSQFLLRLLVLDAPLGVRLEDPRQLGTFRERWHLDPAPELMLRLVDASQYGNTVREGANNRLLEGLTDLNRLTDLAKRIEVALLADLPEAAFAIVDRLEHVGASSSDVPGMLESIAGVAKALRIGAARAVDHGPLAALLDRFVLRASVGLSRAATGANEDEGERIGSLILPVAGLIDGLVAEATLTQWREALTSTARAEGLPGLLAGQLLRHLGDLKLVGVGEQALAFSRALTPGTPHGWSAAWVQGFLGKSGMALLYNQTLFDLLDEWVIGLEPEVFDETLPLLRRSFGAFPKAERRQLAHRVAHGELSRSENSLDSERLAKVNSALDELFGGLG